MLAARASKLMHTEQGFYAEGLDTQTGFKDFADLGGLVAGGYFTADTVKALSADSIAVDQASVKAGTDQVKATEGTKRLQIKESAATERAKIHAETLPAQ